MARLITCGFEAQRLNTTALTTAEGEACYYVGTPAFNTSVQRSGAACLEAAGAKNATFDRAFVLDRTYFVRFAFRRTAAVSAVTSICYVEAASSAIVITARLNTSEELQLGDANGTSVGSTVATSQDTWHLAELKFVVPTAGNGTASLKMDGTAVTTDLSIDVNNAAPILIRFGNSNPSAGTTVYIDDVAVNDDQDASQNTWAGDGKVILLKPTVLGAGGRGNWVDGGGGTTNLHLAVNNTPPVGTAAGSNGTQIENATSGTSSSEFDCTTYTAGGVGGSDTISLLQGLWRVATSSTTSGNTGTARVFGNPDIGGDDAIDFEGAGATAGTDPAGWRTYKGAYAYAPSVTKGSAPQIRITKTVATTRVHSCDLMGVVVEYVPAVSGTTNEETGAAAAGAAVTGVQAKGTQYTKTGAVTAGMVSSAADVAEHAETATVAAGTLGSGADAATHARTGAATPATLASGADVTTHAETATVAAGTLADSENALEWASTGQASAGTLSSGSSEKTVGGIEYVKAGTAAAGTVASAVDVAEHAEAATLAAGTLSSGADVGELDRTGQAAAGAVASAADVAEHAETATAAAGTSADSENALEWASSGVSSAGALSSGSSQKTIGGVEYVKAGTVAAGGVAQAADVFEAAEVGTVVTGTAAAGDPTSAYAEAGTIAAGALQSGADVAEYVESATVAPGVLASGVSSTLLSNTYQKTGTAAAGATASAADAFTGSRTGQAAAATVASGDQAAAFAQEGTVSAGVTASAADATTHAETGTASPGTSATGTGTTSGVLYVKTGTVAAGVSVIGSQVELIEIPPPITERTYARGRPNRSRTNGTTGLTLTRLRVGGASARTLTRAE
jgi:hypothetical protein